MDNQENTSTGSNAAAETETAAAQSNVNFAPGTIGIKKKFNFKQRTVKDESG